MNKGLLLLVLAGLTSSVMADSVSVEVAVEVAEEVVGREVVAEDIIPTTEEVMAVVPAENPAAE